MQIKFGFNGSEYDFALLPGMTEADALKLLPVGAVVIPVKPELPEQANENAQPQKKTRKKAVK